MECLLAKTLYIFVTFYLKIRLTDIFYSSNKKLTHD